MDDVLTISTVPEEVKGASITLKQQCRRGEEVLVEAMCASRLSRKAARGRSRSRCGLP